jgi:hypothetical protein
MNLNLGKMPPARDFNVGPYQITLVRDYDELQSELSEMEKLEWKVNSPDEEPILHPAKVGKSAITAEVECDDEPDAVLATGKEPGIGDLCLILSYVTARRVFLPEHERMYYHINNGYHLVHFPEIPAAAKVAWTNRGRFSSEKEMRPLWYYLCMNDTPIREIKVLLGCVSLEIIQRLRENRCSVLPGKELTDLIEVITNNISESDVPDQLKRDLTSAVGNWGATNAKQAFKDMLINYDLIEPGIIGVPLQRVEGVYKMRNGIVHEGKLVLPNWIEDETMRERVAGFVAVKFIPALVQEYVNRKFQLHCFDRVQLRKKITTEYIYNGTSNGNEIEKRSA